MEAVGLDEDFCFGGSALVRPDARAALRFVRGIMFDVSIAS